ncbi:MAG: LptF/LptG family permease [Deltaproteobacteria bacterium]|nr:LptF/LptG family permease [Deltaproteobacteria bacterium]
MRRLDRYILREILGLLVLGFAVYTFLLLLQYLFSSAEMIIQRGLSVATVGKLLALVLPSSIVLTLPMALLFAILIAVGRFAADSELVALRASGVSLLSLYRPILLLSGLLAAINVYMMVSVLPHGNHALLQLNLKIMTQSVSQQVEPRIFHEQWDDKVLYVFDIPPGQNRWKGVFLAQTSAGEANDIIVADWGEVRVDDQGERLILDLEGAVTHSADLRRPDTYTVSRSDRLEIVLENSFTSSRLSKISASKSVREMDLRELRRKVADPNTSPEMRNLTRVQIQKNFSIPTACLVFGLLALPLGFNNRRGGKTAGFALSMLVIMVYWVLLSNGEEGARFGEVEPWIAMWTPNILFGALGLFLLIRRNSDKSLLLSRVDRWIRQDMWAGLRAVGRWIQGRRQASSARASSARAASARQSGRQGGKQRRIVLRLPRLHFRFASLIDRYIIGRYFWVFLMVLASCVLLYIIADLGENVDNILKNKVPRSVVLGYYKYLSLQILYDIAPIVVLITTLLTFSLLSRANELTAFKALGVSLFRLSLPAIGATVVVVLACAYLQTEILPASNERVAQMKNQIMGRETARTYRRADRQWLFGQGRYVYNYLRFDPEKPSLERLQVFEFDENNQLSRRLLASRANFDGRGWVFEEGWKRSFSGPLVTNYEPFLEPRRSDYPEVPDYFTAEIRPPKQMSYLELRSYIQELESRGEKVPELKVEQQLKISYPAICLVMVLLALPFAFRLGRQGALYGVGLAVVLGMAFLTVFIFFSTLGKAGILPPTIAVWSPNLIFTTLALYLFLGVKT